MRGIAGLVRLSGEGGEGVLSLLRTSQRNVVRVRFSHAVEWKIIGEILWEMC